MDTFIFVYLLSILSFFEKKFEKFYLSLSLFFYIYVLK